MDKKYLKQVGVYVLTSLFSIGLILYIGYHLFYGLTQRIETAPAAPATIHSVIEADVYLFREEILLTAGIAGGSVVPAVPDGTRVGIGDTVARLYDKSAPDVVSALAEADAQIEVLTAMKTHAISLRDTHAIDQSIYGIMEKLSSAARRGDGRAALSYRTELSSALIRRAVITGSAADIDGEIRRLEGEKASLLTQLGVCREEKAADRSGYYFSTPDGYESVFTNDTAQTMTVAEFLALTEKESEPVPERTAGKLVTDYRWYMASLIPAAKAGNLTESDTYAVSFPYNGDTVITMTLTRLVTEGDHAMLVFSADMMPDGFSYTRLQPAVISDNAYTGLRVPASAVRAVDGVTGVYILEGGIVHYRAVKLIVEGENWCLLENAPMDEPPAGLAWLTQNEIVITKGRGLYEGRTLS